MVSFSLEGLSFVGGALASRCDVVTDVRLEDLILSILGSAFEVRCSHSMFACSSRVGALAPTWRLVYIYIQISVLGFASFGLFFCSWPL